MTTDDPTWPTLAIHLLRADCQAFEDALRRSEDLVRVPIRAGSSVDGELFLLPESEDEPSWLEPLVVLVGDLPRVRTTNPGAILMFRAEDRLFAATFGRGHLRLRRERLVDDFGLKIAANRVDPERLVSLDSRAVEQTVFQMRRQASRGSGAGAMGLETTRETISALTGRPRDANFADRVTGREAVLITRDVGPEELPALAAILLEAYGSRDYEQSFSAIDQRRRIEDPTRIADLDQALVTALAAPERGGAYLAPPEVLDWSNVSGFRFTGDPRGIRRAEPTIRDYALLRGGTITLEGLLSDHLSAVARDTERAATSWPIHRCLIWERREEDGAYVLADGHWWRIDPGFIAQIDRVVGSITESDVTLVPYRPAVDADEAAYNVRAAAAVEGAAALDAQLARAIGERGPIELCDIAGPGRRLVHVKRGLRAERLSHLFAQSVGSAEALRHLPEVRRQLKDLLEPALPDLAGQVPVEDGMEASAWEVVIAIITDQPERVPKKLPFFSRAHLARTITTLKRLDYKVAYRAVDIDRT